MREAAFLRQTQPLPPLLQSLFLQQVRGLLVSHSRTSSDPTGARFSAPTYDLDLPKIVVEQPPKVELGEYAMPLAFELAKKLRKAPRKIAEEIVNGVGPIEGFEKLEVAAPIHQCSVQRGAVPSL